MKEIKPILQENFQFKKRRNKSIIYNFWQCRPSKSVIQEKIRDYSTKESYIFSRPSISTSVGTFRYAVFENEKFEQRDVSIFSQFSPICDFRRGFWFQCDGKFYDFFVESKSPDKKNVYSWRPLWTQVLLIKQEVEKRDMSKPTSVSDISGLLGLNCRKKYMISQPQRPPKNSVDFHFDGSYTLGFSASWMFFFLH